MPHTPTTQQPFPNFAFDSQAIVNTLDSLLKENLDTLASHLKTAKQTTTVHWSNFIAPLETMENAISILWSPLSHLNNVMASDDIRRAYESGLALLSDYYDTLALDPELFALYERVLAEDGTLCAVKQRACKLAIDAFKRAGVHCSDKDKALIRAINSRLDKLSSQFSHYVMDATDSWYQPINDALELTGLNAGQKQLLANNAKKHGLTSGYALGLDAPSYHAVITFCENAAHRRTVYEAQVTKASAMCASNPQWDNGPILAEILRLRQEKAALLGYDNYAEYSLANKMADNAAAVNEFLKTLLTAIQPSAQMEFDQLCQFAQQQGLHEPLQPWDIAFYTEKYRQSCCQVSSESLRPYLVTEQVITGLFQIVHQLFDVHISVMTPPTAHYHPDVVLYQLHRGTTCIGYCYMDLYAREKKRGGAWMDSFCGRMRNPDDQQQYPIAYLTCNFMPPNQGEAARLNHDEVITLFHEFGHCLHHLLTQVDVLSVSGIAQVPWDGVELPSQLFEHWCWQEAALSPMSASSPQGDLPPDILQRVIDAKQFMAGMHLIRQLYFAHLDMAVHLDPTVSTEQAVRDRVQRIHARVAVTPRLEADRFQNSFSHIFAGGYAAGYYSYLWAEVLSSDVFSIFEDQGIFSRSTGEAYRDKLLSLGGSKDFMQCFIDFVGRKPSIQAFLRHHGLS